jgi:hypothetical protein
MSSTSSIAVLSSRVFQDFSKFKEELNGEFKIRLVGYAVPNLDEYGNRIKSLKEESADLENQLQQFAVPLAQEAGSVLNALQNCLTAIQKFREDVKDSINNRKSQVSLVQADENLWNNLETLKLRYDRLCFRLILLDE